MDIVLAPCGKQIELTDGSFSEPRVDCNWDQGEAENYLR